MGGFGVSWWYTKKSFKLVDDISFIITKNYEEFSGCDNECINALIKETLNEICIDNRIFNSSEVCFGKFSGKDTLFSCKNCNDTKLFASIIADELFSKIREKNIAWCIIYSVPRLSGDSFSIPSEGLTVLNKTDKAAWTQLISGGSYWTDMWCPITGMYFQNKTTPFSGYPYDYIFVSEQMGTANGSKFSTSLKLKKLFSVIYSVVGIESDYLLHKCGADPFSICLQFPRKESMEGIHMGHIGELLPYYLDNYFLTPNNIETIQNWYKQEILLEKESKNRIEKSAHFINHAMSAKDIEAYISYFISLDALFGERGSVEESIREGVNSLPSSEQWNDKISWLYDLRNELIHGGSRYIKEWPRYYNYYRHFRSKPDSDLKKLAFTALSSAPKLFQTM